MFHFEPHSIEDVVTDSKSSIPLSTGVDSSFYPQTTHEDPYPTQDRGYFFTGASHMQYECGVNCNPSLVISPEFTLTAWVKPTSSSGTIFAKQKKGSFAKTVSLGLDSDYVKLDLEAKDYDQVYKCFFSEGWNFVAVLTSVSSEVKARIQTNTTCTDLISLGENWLKDVQDNYFIVVGASLSGTNSFTNFFSGFIWEIRLYNQAKDTNALVKSSGCEGCTHCPINHECISSCPINHFWNGRFCQNCRSQMNKGCVNPTFKATLTTETDNSLSLKFSEDLKASLKRSNFRIELQNKTIEYNYSLEELSLNDYKINMEFDSFVSEGEPVELSFTTEVLSEFNGTLEKNSIQTELYEYDLASIKTQQAKEQAQILSAAAGVITIIFSLLNTNPSTLWKLANTLDILYYITLSNNPLTPNTRGFLQGMELSESFRAYLEYGLKATIKIQPTKYLPNLPVYLLVRGAANNIFVMVVLLATMPFVWSLSKLKLGKVQLKLKSLLKEYKYNTFIRYWIQSYLDILIACFIQLLVLPDGLEILSYLLACLVTFLAIVTPVALHFFNRKYKIQIITLGEESVFYLTYGTLFYEFKQKFRAAYYYFVFILMRLGIAASLVFLKDYPYIQAAVNTGLVLVHSIFIWVMRPYSEKSQQITSDLTEGAVLAVFALTVSFLNSNWQSSFYKVEQAIIYTATGVLLFQTSVAVFGVGYRIYSYFKSKRQARVADLRRSNFTALSRGSQCRFGASRVLQKKKLYKLNGNKTLKRETFDLIHMVSLVLNSTFIEHLFEKKLLVE